MSEYHGYVIQGDGTYGYKKIRPVGKGSVPLELRGDYTTEAFARQAIDIFISTEKGKKKNGKDISAS